MKKEFDWTRFVCWKCRTPYERRLVNDLPVETVRAIMKGVRRKRYLNFCKVCNNAGDALPYVSGSTPMQEVVRIPQLWKAIEKKHLVMLDHRCQICKIKDREDVKAYPNTKARLRRFLQRDLIALCTDCHKIIARRLGTREDV